MGKYLRAMALRVLPLLFVVAIVTAMPTPTGQESNELGSTSADASTDPTNCKSECGPTCQKEADAQKTECAACASCWESFEKAQVAAKRASMAASVGSNDPGGKGGKGSLGEGTQMSSEARVDAADARINSMNQGSSKIKPHLKVSVAGLLAIDSLVWL